MRGADATRESLLTVAKLVHQEVKFE